MCYRLRDPRPQVHFSHGTMKPRKISQNSPQKSPSLFENFMRNFMRLEVIRISFPATPRKTEEAREASLRPSRERALVDAVTCLAHCT